MMNLILLAAVLSIGTPTTQPANVELDSQKAVATTGSEEATWAPATCEQEPLASLASESEVLAGGSAVRDLEPLGLRYCCTPPQVQACAATGGTTTCRTGVCQCQF